MELLIPTLPLRIDMWSFHYVIEISDCVIIEMWVCNIPAAQKEATIVTSGGALTVKVKWKWKVLSRVQLFVTPWTVQSMEFSRPAY